MAESKSVTWTINKASPGLTLSESSLTVKIGTPRTVTATYTGGGTLSAVSSDSSVVSVSVSGNVITLTAESAGSATITVSVGEVANYLPQTSTIAATTAKTGEVVYVGTATPLSAARINLGAASVGNYALFAGGYDGSYLNIVDAYYTDLSSSQAATLYVTKDRMGSAAVAGYALFVGGERTGNSSYTTNSVDAYSQSLTHTNPTQLGTARSNIAAATTGGYALFAGGIQAFGDTTGIASALVVSYDASLTYALQTSLSISRSGLAGVSVGNYALFGGGVNNGSQSTVDAYDTALTRTTTSDGLRTAVYGLAATSAGEYALFGGGYTGSYAASRVTAYDTSLTRVDVGGLSSGSVYLTATSIKGSALFGGGRNSISSGIETANVNAYDETLTQTIPTGLSQARSSLAATTVGDYALFAGGNVPSNYSAVVDVYTA